jgi:3-oxoacyl-[acyl-carrier protein] reductase
MTDAQPLAGKVAMVTGGSRGVGLATANLLARHGVSVALLGRDASHLYAAETAIRDAAPAASVSVIVADVTDATEMERAVQQTERELGGLDILVNNAGIGRYGAVHEMPVEDWQRVIEVNVLGVFFATRAALPALRRRGGGQVIAISSGAARQGYPNMSAYCASKAGLEGFMRALAAEVAGEPIKVATIVPGSILTDFGVRTREDRLRSGAKFLEAQDVAEAVLFLLRQPDRAWTQELTLWPR